MKKRDIVLAIASGLVLATALPEPGWWTASWFGLVPLLIAAKGTTSKRAALIGFVSGFVYFGLICRWLVIFGYLPWFLVSAKEALWFALFLATVSRFLQEPIRTSSYLVIPTVWTVIQWARVFGPLGFTWGSFAHSQADVLPIIQISALTGPWAIDFLLCSTNTVLADVIFHASERACRKTMCFRVSLVATIIAATWIYGYFALTKSSFADKKHIKVAIVQASMTHDVNPKPEYVVEAYATHAAMTQIAALDKPDIIVWPETTIVDCITDQAWGPLIGRLAKETNANFIVGGYDWSGDPQGRNYNAAHFFDQSGRRIGVYRKVHLVPYGEYVPFRKQMPWLKKYGIREVDVLPGKTHNVIKTSLGAVGTAICFESIFPAVTTQEARHGAKLLVILTNDAWFKRTNAAQQHLMMARLRAVETHRYVVRAAATGISAVIDPHGRICSSLGLFQKGILQCKVVALNSATPYVRYGDWFIYVCLGIISTVGIIGIRGLVKVAK